MAHQRRLTERMKAQWSTLARGARLPRYGDLNINQFGTDLAHCFVAETGGEIGASKLIYVGALLRGADEAVEGRRKISDYPEDCLLRLAAAKIPAVIAKRGPITFGGTGVCGIEAILYRAILLPLTDGETTVDYVIGAINFREITAVEEYSDDITVSSMQPKDNVTAHIAFASRRLAFAPSGEKKPMQVTIK